MDQKVAEEFETIEELEAYAKENGFELKSAESEGVAISSLTSANVQEVLAGVSGEKMHKGYFFPGCKKIYYLVKHQTNKR